ncbi:MarR family winged helix-turn-helix transcriptional regulator [Microbacterium luticocti]|uniref:MarR family winged helix-turn-helix transcriptional regulator n=1 Tax=Microbacterium luticocti TaxID=451764 RepID=UPI0004214916|nr:MarR family transcriptional regulator [Microbacterium luticocti]
MTRPDATSTPATSTITTIPARSTTASTDAVLLAALTALMSDWSSPRVQARFARLAGVDLDAADIHPLYHLGMHGPTRASDLASALQLSRPTMSKQLARLAAARLIERSPDPTDGRAVLVSLSPEGTRIHAALVARGRDAVREALATWHPDDRRRFAELTTRFVAAVGVDVPTTPAEPASPGDRTPAAATDRRTS